MAAGCGGDDPAPQAAPAETSESSAAGTPGAPKEGEPDYTGLGTWWTELPKRRREASAAEFAADNPEACEGAASVDLARQTLIAFGYDFPEAIPVSAVMLETCALLNAD